MKEISVTGTPPEPRTAGGCGRLRMPVLFWLLVMLAGTAKGEFPGDPVSGLKLFTDRPWVVSGDTIWFWLSATYSADRHSTVASVQLENTENMPVNKVSVFCGERGGTGYFPVPDSLQTGIYWLRAYTAHMRDLPRISVSSRLLAVFNRFAGEIPEIEVPVSPRAEKLSEISEKITIMPETEKTGTRDTIRFSLRFSPGTEDQISDMVIGAALDWNPAGLPDSFYVPFAAPVTPNPRHPLPPATDGTIIEGRVVPADGGDLPAKSLVILSVPGTFPVFDYYFAGSDGYFRFILKDATGTATVFLQAIAEGNRRLTVITEDNPMCGIEACRMTSVSLNQDDGRFLKDQLDAAHYYRIFSDRRMLPDQPLLMPYPCQYPFYGKPDLRIFPAEFTDLPGFGEISRELLPGVKYRLRQDTVTLQLLNIRDKAFFEKNPLRLINGIPLFDNNLLSGFSSNDIEYIDVVNSERILGDLSFKGVVALYLKDEQKFWYSGLPGLRQYFIPCRQAIRSPGYNSLTMFRKSPQEPDFRQVFLFRHITPAEAAEPFFFVTSDLKGIIRIKVQGVTTSGLPFESTCKLMVK